MGVYPLTYQSGEVSFSEWINILTLGLAPLIAHVAGGAPLPSFLSPQPTRWHDMICLYNPTSIIWRYAAIADRRIRARHWSRADLAASNAVFWTDTGGGGGGARDDQNRGHARWDGSEAMAAIARPHCSRLPLHARTDLLSWDAITTVIITLQAASALWSVIYQPVDPAVPAAAQHSTQDAADHVFSPLAIIGIFRLAAAWLLASDFNYHLADGHALPVAPTRGREESEAGQATSVLLSSSRRQDRDAHDGEEMAKLRPASYEGSGPWQMDVMERGSTQQHLGHQLVGQAPDDGTRTGQFRPTSYLPSVAFRSVFLVLFLGVWVLSLLKVTPKVFAPSGGGDRSATNLITTVFYLFLMTVSCALYAWYFYRGGTTSTLLPCINSPWYKAYSVLVFALIFFVLVVACCETKVMPCGSNQGIPTYTSVPSRFWEDLSQCH